MARVTARFLDGIEEKFEAVAGQSVLAAALAAGIPLIHQCQSGSCGTCVARLADGRAAAIAGRAQVLLPDEMREGLRLTCSNVAETDCVFQFDYPSTLLREGEARLWRGAVESAEPLAADTVRLRIALEGRDKPVYAAGQYMRLKIPGTESWRSYSMASLPGELPRLDFLVRLLPEGAMASYLRSACRPGDTIEMEGPLGSFRLSGEKGRHILIAGGTGLAPILAMLDELRTRPGPRSPVLLCFGCRTRAQIYYLDELELRGFWMPNLTQRIAVDQPPAGDGVRLGNVVSLLEQADIVPGATEAYICGPPPMVAAARARLAELGLPAGAIWVEQFRASAR